LDAASRAIGRHRRHCRCACGGSWDCPRHGNDRPRRFLARQFLAGYVFPECIFVRCVFPWCIFFARCVFARWLGWSWMAARPSWSGQRNVRKRRGVPVRSWPAREEPGSVGRRRAIFRAGDGWRLGTGERVGPGGRADGRATRNGRRPVATPSRDLPATLGVASRSRGSRLAGSISQRHPGHLPGPGSVRKPQ
jgi:hypothetical protein